MAARSAATSASTLDLLRALSAATSASTRDLRRAASEAALEAAISAASLDLRRAFSVSMAATVLHGEELTWSSRGSRGSSRDRGTTYLFQ